MVCDLNCPKFPVVQIEQVLANMGHSVRKIVYLGSGDDSDTLLCDNSYVIKIPKRPAVYLAQQREFALYAFFGRQKLSFVIPKALYQGETFNIMQFISGETISYRDYSFLSEREKELLAEDMAIFLRELHRIIIPAADKPFCEIIENKREKYCSDQTEILRVLESLNLLSGSLYEKILSIYDRIYSNAALFRYKPCLTHNDFSTSNMVFRGNRLYGVIDFGDACIGDPDNDFLCLLDCSTDDFGKNFGRKVLRHYGHPYPDLAERKAEINDAYWPIQQILLGEQREDEQLIQNGYNGLLNTEPESFVL